MQSKFGDQSEHNVTDGSCGQHVGEIGPGKRHHVTGKKYQQKQDAQRDNGIQDYQDNVGQMMQRDVPDLLHATRDEAVAGSRKKGYSCQDQVLAKSHRAFPYALAGWTAAVESSF